MVVPRPIPPLLRNFGTRPQRPRVRVSELKADMGDGSVLEHRQRRPSKSVSFDKVTVYEFPRVQGFSCIPTRGGMTLGLDFRHVDQYTCFIHQDTDGSLRPPGSNVGSETSPLVSAISEGDVLPSLHSGSDLDLPQEEVVQKEKKPRRLQLEPLSCHRRRQLLLDSGVQRIDSSEAKQCRDIRASRGSCGCDCLDQCLPEACSCSLNGVPCQVEKKAFPCACLEKACKNPSGRRQYSPDIVHEHYRRTMERLEMEQAAEEMPIAALRLDARNEDVKDDDGFTGQDDGLPEDFERACSLTEAQ